MLSRRLKALVMPTIQAMVTSTSRASPGMNDVRTPEATTMPAARICPAALSATGNRLPKMSSASPTMKTTTPPAISPSSFAFTVCAWDSIESAAPTELRADVDSSSGGSATT